MSQLDRFLRWLLAFVLMGSGFTLGKFGYENLNFLWWIPAILLAVLGVGLVFKDLLHLGAKPFTAMIDAIVFPIIPAGKPKPNYRLAEYYVRENLLEDAEIEYRTILKNHGNEKRAYLALIELLVQQDDIHEAKKVFRKAKRKLRYSPDDMNDLEMLWHRLQLQFQNSRFS